MSLKKFLQEKGYIQNDTTSKTENRQNKVENEAPDLSQVVEPTYFPIQDIGLGDSHASENVAPAQHGLDKQETQAPAIDHAFVKFFEDELMKANLPGPDYFEFRKQMLVMNQKMGKKGTSAEVLLQAVLTSFEAQNISSSKLIETAKQYKESLLKKKNEFLKGASTEKDKQFQKRENALRTHQANLSQMNIQLVQLQNQLNQLQDMIKREQTQMEVDRTLGKEGIEKIERAEKQISLAHDIIISTIDNDINQLQSA